MLLSVLVGLARLTTGLPRMHAENDGIITMEVASNGGISMIRREADSETAGTDIALTYDKPAGITLNGSVKVVAAAQTESEMVTLEELTAECLQGSLLLVLLLADQICNFPHLVVKLHKFGGEACALVPHQFPLHLGKLLAAILDVVYRGICQRRTQRSLASIDGIPELLICGKELAVASKELEALAFHPKRLLQLAFQSDKADDASLNLQSHVHTTSADLHLVVLQGP